MIRPVLTNCQASPRYGIHLFLGITALCLLLNLWMGYYASTHAIDRLPDTAMGYAYGIDSHGMGAGLDIEAHWRYINHFGLSPDIYQYFLPDPIDRTDGYIYPPLLVATLCWLRYIPMSWAPRIMFGLNIILLWVCLFVIMGRGVSKPIKIITCLLLSLSYPVFLGAFRGATDIWVLLCALCTWSLFKKQWYATAGVLSAYLILVKIYPVFFVGALMILSLALRRDNGKSSRFFWGFLWALSLQIAILWHAHVAYWTQAMPRFSARYCDIGGDIYSHSILTHFGIASWIVLLVICMFTGYQIYKNTKLQAELDVSKPSPQHLATYKESVFFILALSGYLVPVSYDYNLVLVLPWLWIALESCGGRGVKLLATSILLIILCLGMFGSRLLYYGLNLSPHFFIACSLSTLVLFALRRKLGLTRGQFIA